MIAGSVKVLIGSVIASAVASAASAQDTYRIRVADSFPLTHVISRDGAQFFAQRLEELSDGRLTVEHYPASQLGKATDMLPLVQAGAVDMAYIAPAYFSAKMPLSDIFHLPGIYDDVCAGSATYMAAASEGMVKTTDYDSQDIRLVFATPLSPYELSGRSVAIRSLDDFANRKIRSTSSATNLVVAALGGVAVNLPGGAEIYDALERGTIDFNLGPYSSYKAYDLYEQTEYATDGFGFSYFVAAYSISNRAYNALPDDLKAIVDQAGQETSAHVCNAVKEEQATALREMRELGVEFLMNDPEQQERYDQLVQDVQERWVADANGKGLEGTAAIEEIRGLLSN